VADLELRQTQEQATASTDPRFVDPSSAVTVAYTHSNNVTYSWHHSIVELIGWDMANHARILRGGYVAMRCGTDGLVEGRNRAVREFLADGRADWLFWADTDQGFEPDTVDRLIEAADPHLRPIVGALCFSQREIDADGMGGWRCAPTPTVFDWAKIQTETGEQQGFAVRWDYPPDTVLRCAGTGSACILIHRSAFEAVRNKCGPSWYDKIPNITTGQRISEDLSFCVRAGALGIPIHVHTGVRTTHMKTVWVAEEDYWRQRAFEPPAAQNEEAA
jgi:hypothetical protein